MNLADHAAEVVDRGEGSDVVGEVLLAAQQHGAEVARQADSGGTSEQGVALGCCAVIQRKTVFQVEQRLHAAAQVFAALEADARTLDRTGIDADAVTVAGTGSCHLAVVRQAGVDDAVDGDRALRMCDAGEGAQHCQCQEGLSHEELQRLLNCCLIVGGSTTYPDRGNTQASRKKYQEDLIYLIKIYFHKQFNFLFF